MLNRVVLTWLVWVLGLLSTSVFWLSSMAQKEAECNCDLVLESPNLIYWAPEWFVPHSLSTAPENASYWIEQVLPFEQYRNEDMYLVFPQMWSIMPIVSIPEGSSDFTKMVSWWEIEINNYLQHWIIEYANSTQPGHRWKRVDFWHSNMFANAAWSFNNILADHMRLDVWDEAWYFVRNSSGSYDLIKYRITQSYNTPPTNVRPLLWDGDGADALIFFCTYWLDGRWMLEAELIGEPVGKPFNPYQNLDNGMKWKIDQAIRKIGRLRENRRQYTIIQLVKVLNNIRAKEGLKSVPTHSYQDLNSQEIIIQYIEDRLVEMY